ncbi:MAG: hypothetical protein AMJ94_09370 [Deltaproteobacteria bacterium SM23_61]|nr:MAG: hypothetical protein AMJ94_09370 [Deltaproteobacteria bacterium SM23_61]
MGKFWFFQGGVLEIHCQSWTLVSREPGPGLFTMFKRGGASRGFVANLFKLALERSKRPDFKGFLDSCYIM